MMIYVYKSQQMLSQNAIREAVNILIFVNRQSPPPHPSMHRNSATHEISQSPLPDVHHEDSSPTQHLAACQHNPTTTPLASSLGRQSRVTPRTRVSRSG